MDNLFVYGLKVVDSTFILILTKRDLENIAEIILGGDCYVPFITGVVLPSRLVN